MEIEERIESSRHLRGQIEACEARMKRCHAQLGVHNAEIAKQMGADLKEKYGKDYAPRITFYASERAAAVPYLVKFGERNEEKVSEILSSYHSLINNTPALQSLLYDLNMLPEQTVTIEGAVMVAGICEAYKAGKGD